MHGAARNYRGIDEHATPQSLIDRLVERFGMFALDPCASAENAKAPLFFTREDDGLSRSWVGTGAALIFMNPPYGPAERACVQPCTKKRCVKRGHHLDRDFPGIGAWVKKAFEESLAGATVVCLLPASTDTAWWHTYCQRQEHEFIRGRIRFEGSRFTAPFPSVIVVMRG
jgi:site-specific DNA-methyltransferase (adenine-specific)